MNESDIIKLRKAQLELAKEVKRLCEKHRISFFLDAGSLLGAVRHEGFIPWDDDMDIGMCKEDYEKFLNIAANELKEEFFLDNYHTNPNCPFVYSKLRLRNTIYIEDIGNENLEHNEIFIDIFPYYYISDNLIQRKIEALQMSILAQALMSKYGYKVWKNKGLLKRVKFLGTDFLGKILPISYLHKMLERLFNKHNNTKKMGGLCGSCYDYWFFPEQVLRETENHLFEKELFPIPVNYNEFLKQAYGDYMVLPPLNLRRTHQIKKLDFGNYE